MSEMKEMLVEVVEKIFKDKVEKETVDLLEEGKWAGDVWKLLRENEMLNVAVAEEYGGAGGDIEDLFNLYRLVGKYAVPVPFVEHTLANVLLEQMNQRPLDDMATFSFSKHALQWTEDGVTGVVANVPWGRHAKYLVTFAWQGEDRKMVVMDLQGAQVTEGMNLASEPRDDIAFHNVQPVEETMLSEEQFSSIAKTITAATVSKMSGAVDKAFELTVRFSKEREQFGRPIHRFQLVQQHLAVLAGEQALTAAAVDNLLEALQHQVEGNEVAFARLRMDDASRIVTSGAHQVHAAIGVTHEHSLHQYTRRLWAWREEDFTAQYWKKQLAKQVLADEQDIWVSLTAPKKIHQPS